jgi:hypothetical protein
LNAYIPPTSTILPIFNTIGGQTTYGHTFFLSDSILVFNFFTYRSIPPLASIAWPDGLLPTCAYTAGTGVAMAKKALIAKNIIARLSIAPAA